MDNDKRRQWREAFNEMQEIAERTLAPLLEKPAAQPPKRQHYIPQFWLDGFTQDGNAEVLDVAGPRAVRVPKGLRSIAAEDDYYTLKSKDGEADYWVERYLGWFEDQASDPGRWKNLEVGEMVADPLSRLFVAQFLVVQMLRGPSFRQTLKTLAEVMAYDLLATAQAAGDLPATQGALTIEATPEGLVLEMASLAADHEQPRQLFLRRWGLHESPDETGWALPMEPVVGLGGIAPLSSPIIWVPVSRRFLLSMSWDYSGSMPEEQRAQPMPAQTAVLARKEIIAHAQRQPIAHTRRLIVHPDDAGAWQGWCFRGPEPTDGPPGPV